MRLAEGGTSVGATDVRSMLFTPRNRDPDAMRRERVRELFLVRCPAKRTANDVLIFFLWLQRCSPDLLPKRGAPYHHLKTDLDGLYLYE